MVNLYQTFLNLSEPDQDNEVCSNSVYALGVLAANALPEMIGCVQYYSVILYIPTIYFLSTGPLL